jgi:hypothetical protein
VQGEHTLSVDFPGGAAADLLEQTPVLDLVYEDESNADPRCLRIAVSGAAPELRWKRRLDGSANWAIRFEHPWHPVGSVDDAWSFDFGMGRWLGPVRARVEVGAGFAGCSGLCPPQPDGGAGFTRLAVRAAFDGYVVQGRGIALAAEIGYEQASSFRANPDQTTRWETGLGPRAALRFDLTPAPPAGWPAGGRQGSFGLELSVGESFAVDTPDHAVVIGIGVVNFVGF